jgi:hypothetical protein
MMMIYSRHTRPNIHWGHHGCASFSSVVEGVRPPDGSPVANLWAALSGAFWAAGLPPYLPVKRVLLARFIVLPPSISSLHVGLHMLDMDTARFGTGQYPRVQDSLKQCRPGHWPTGSSRWSHFARRRRGWSSTVCPPSKTLDPNR